jgi:hypothetical protein
MIENSTLQLPDYNSEFNLQTFVGNYAIGATLSRMVGTTLQPVAFYSKPLSDIELKKSTTFRDLIAINYAINHFKTIFTRSKIHINYKAWNIDSIFFSGGQDRTTL